MTEQPAEKSNLVAVLVLIAIMVGVLGGGFALYNSWTTELARDELERRQGTQHGIWMD